MKKSTLVIALALYACADARGNTTGITAGQIKTAAPGAFSVSGVAAAEGTSTAICRADHAHSLTGTLPQGSGGTGAGALTCAAGQPLTSNGTAQLCESAPVAIAYGGTGSATQNFVDLTTNQSIAGIKTFTTNVVVTSSGGVAGVTSTGSGAFPAGTFTAGATSPGITAGSGSYPSVAAPGTDLAPPTGLTGGLFQGLAEGSGIFAMSGTNSTGNHIAGVVGLGNTGSFSAALGGLFIGGSNGAGNDGLRAYGQGTNSRGLYAAASGLGYGGDFLGGVNATGTAGQPTGVTGTAASGVAYGVGAYPSSNAPTVGPLHTGTVTTSPSGPSNGDWWIHATKGVYGYTNSGSTFGMVVFKRTAGCATAASLAATCTTVVTWATAFADTNYTATCTGDLITSGVPLNGGFTAKAGASVTFQTVSATSAAAQYTTIDCTAVHDS